MKFFEILRFELLYQLRRSWPWLIIPLLMVLVFLFMRDGSLAEALYTEFFINSPFKIAMATVFGSLLWLVTSAFVSGEAAARDVSTGMHPMVYTVPISRAQYLGGRFVAALVLNAGILLFVQLAILLAIYLPGVHPESIGPFRPEAFITAYLFIAVPNAFTASAIQFSLATATGRPITAYMGSLLLFFTTFFVASLILFRGGPGALLDPIGVHFIWSDLSHLWTTVEKSHRLLELKGTILQNRLLWIETGVAVITLTYLRFRFVHRTLGSGWWTRIIGWTNSGVGAKTANANLSNVRSEMTRADYSRRNFGFAFNVRQVASIARSSFLTLSTSWVGLGFLLGIPLMAIPVVIDQMIALSLPLIPVTSRVISELTGPLSADMSRWMVVPGFIIYFAGELTWREREHGLGEITDVMPGSEWPPLLGKLIGIWLVLVVFTACVTSAGIVAQLIMGYTTPDIALYLKVMFGLQLPEYILFSTLALFVHTLVDQKYVGHLVAIIAYAFIAAIATMLGVEHNLLIYGAGPGWSYTEMRGFGLSIGPWIWFKLYWAAWALIIIATATLLRVRGMERRFAVRIQLARLRLTKPTMWVAGLSAALIVSLGGFIFYNTNVLNTYLASSEVEALRAEYERRYGQYENIPQPRLTATNLHVEIYPDRRRVDIRGSYRLLNNNADAIDSIHVSTSMSGASSTAITFDRNTTLVLDDDQHAYRIYTLDDPLRPGDTLQLNFEVSVASQGFTNRGIDPSLTSSGSYFTNKDWFPVVGYQRQRGLINPAQRREHGLEPRAVIASLYEAHDGEGIPLGSGVAFDAVMGTPPDQVAAAPGRLQRTWTENGRRYFKYTSSAPIGNEWAFFSARYQVFDKEWIPADSSQTPVVVRIFHDAKHTAHLTSMMRAVHAALEYYTTQFGPYPYNHLNVIEHPAAPGTGMHADASLIYYGQGYPYWIPKDDHVLDLPYAIMGHEMGHQWTLPYAFVEGLPFLSEGIAWYYGIQLVKATRGPEQTRRLMSFMRFPYPHQPIRRGEPLLRALDPYLAYKRGPLAMYALSEYACAERVNRAIRTLNEKSDLPGARPVTTLDLYRELQRVTPDSLQNMLREFFEVNTLWLLETTNVSAIKKAEGKWDVTLDIIAKKIVYDSAGVETEVPMDEWIPVGVFATSAPGFDELSTPLYLQKHHIQSGNQTITVSVAGEPALAGIDPHHLLDWEEKEDDDNLEDVNVDEYR